MATSLEDLLSGETPSQTTPPSPESSPAPSEPVETQASSVPELAPALNAESTPSEPPKAEEPEAAEPQGDDRDGTGNNDGLPPSPAGSKEESDPKVRAFQKKSQDEVRKRQDIERQLKESNDRYSALEKQLAELRGLVQAPRPQQPQPQQPQPQRAQAARRGPPPPDPDAEPGQAVRYLGRMTQQTLQAQREQIEQEMTNRHIVQTQEIARMRFQDYDDMEAAFADEAEKNPALFDQMRRHQNPAYFAYEMGKRFKAMAEMGNDPYGWKTQQEQSFAERLAEERKKWEEEAQASRPAPAAPSAPQQAAPSRPAAPRPPPSLAGATSAAPRNPTTRFDGPTPLEKLLA